MLSKLDLDPKCQGHSRNQKLMSWGTKNMPPKKNLSRGCLSNWCDADADADADADSSKTICRPPPYGGVDITITEMFLRHFLSESDARGIFYFLFFKIKCL